MKYQQIKGLAESLAPYCTEARHTLHSIAELSNQEFKTNAYLCEKLDEIGVPYRTEKTWIIGTIEGCLDTGGLGAGGSPGKTVALRADIDALPIQEQTGLPYASKHPGVMHACGHDAHAAIQLAVAKLLYGLRDQFHGTVRLLFQPAEETTGGAVPLIQAGAMLNVDAVYGLHVVPQAPVGRIACRPGPMYAATDALHIDILGKKGHGAHPACGVDAIAIAAQVITALQTLISREIEATESSVITIGTIHGGTANNVLCDEVKLYGTLRTLTEDIRVQMHRRIPALCQGIAAAMGGGARTRIEAGYCACLNDVDEANRVLSVAEEMFGAAQTYILRNSSLGAEDFAYYLKEAPGAIYHLGCGGDAPGHNEMFAVDDACLPVGVAMQAALALGALGV